MGWQSPREQLSRESSFYGSLKGVPPTYVYSGSQELLGPDVLVLAQEAATQGAPISFVLRTGKIDDWALPTTSDGLFYFHKSIRN